MRWLVALAATLVFGGGVADALPIAIGSHERSATVEASAGADSDVQGESIPDTGFATLDLHAGAGDTGAFATGDASQFGNASTVALGAGGRAYAEARASAPDAFAQGSADSLYRVEFTPDTDVLVRLLGDVTATASGAADAFTFVELASVDSTLDPLLLRYEAEPGDGFSFNVYGVALQGGLTYRLTAFARVSADALDDELSWSEAIFTVGLHPVPEPGTALLLLLGVAALAARPGQIR